MPQVRLPLMGLPGAVVGDTLSAKIVKLDGPDAVVDIYPSAPTKQDFQDMPTDKLEEFLLNSARDRNYNNPPASINPKPPVLPQ